MAVGQRYGLVQSGSFEYLGTRKYNPSLVVNDDEEVSSGDMQVAAAMHEILFGNRRRANR
jgi:hypothetical protein